MNVSEMKTSPKQKRPMVRLCFIHIPKTAGTSFALYMMKNVYKEKASPLSLTMQYFLHKGDLADFMFYSGHLFFSFAPGLLPADTHFATMFRDPVERAVSHYNHIRDKDRNHYYYGLVSSMTFGEFIRDPRTAPLISDFQARYIVHHRPLEFNLGAFQFQKAIETDTLFLPSCALYSRTMARLNKFFSVIGTQDNLYSFIERVLALVAPDMSPGLVFQRDHKHAPDLSERDRKYCESINQVDRALYEYARKQNDNNARDQPDQ